MKRTYTMQISKTINYQDISDLLCNAFEGGSNYWYFIEDYVEPEKVWKGNDGQEDRHFVYPHLQYPLSQGGAVIISDSLGDDENARYRLDLSAIEKGLDTMASKYPGAFGDFLRGEADSETGDTFLQCCLFGDAPYG